MLKIGEFARRGRVPVKTLRYYDEIGLLKPDGIDRWTRYRYYTDAQLPDLERILALKRLGFSLDDVAYLLRTDLPPGDLAALLRARRSALHQEIIAAQHRLAQVDAWIDETEHRAGTKERTMQQPERIETLGPFLVVGMPYLGKNEHGEIAAMWEVFNRRVGEIKHSDPNAHVAYGVCSPNPQGLVDYVAALPVTSLDDIPAGMKGLEVPAQTYVVEEAHGLKDIMGAYDRILHHWLPASGYEPGGGPDFELYPATWENAESTLYIYFPVKKG
jgi:predicted transcriptional regulator YdeE